MRFLLAALVLMVVGCTSTKAVVCDLSKSISTVVAASVASQLTCSNMDAIKATIDVELAKTKVCDVMPVAAMVKTQSVIGDVVCGPLVEALAAGALKTIPAAWGCTGGATADTVKAQLLAACQKI